jgi:hypothetical protein
MINLADHKFTIMLVSSTCLLLSVIIVVLWMNKGLFLVFKKIAEDTLMKDGKWSRTSLTMLSAWIVAVQMAIFDLIKTEKLNFEVFVVFIGVALGSKIVNAYSNKIDPTIPNAPQPENSSAN